MYYRFASKCHKTQKFSRRRPTMVGGAGLRLAAPQETFQTFRRRFKRFREGKLGALLKTLMFSAVYT